MSWGVESHRVAIGSVTCSSVEALMTHRAVVVVGVVVRLVIGVVVVVIVVVEVNER